MKGFEAETLRRYERSVVFRHIQVLIGIFNDIQRGPLAIILISASILAEAFALTLLVRSSNVDVVFYVTLVCILLNGLMVSLGILSQMAMIYKNSHCIIEMMTWKNSLKMKSHEAKWEQAFYRSCAPLKILIYSGEFVNTCTPLKCLQYGMELSANLLIIT